MSKDISEDEMNKHTISVRVSEKEFIAIKNKAFSEGRSIGSWCKYIILGKIKLQKKEKIKR